MERGQSPPLGTATATNPPSLPYAQPQTHAHAQSQIDMRRAQAWKDLQRDALKIDGEVVSGGDVGAEGVLGAFVRHLVSGSLIRGEII